MSNNLHYSFSNIAAEQDYLLDDVITELTRVRNTYLSNLKVHFGKVTAVMEAEKPGFLEHWDRCNTQDLVSLHNAVLIAESLVEKGDTTIKLNPKKDLVDQVLVKAIDYSEINTKVGAHAAQTRLAR